MFNSVKSIWPDTLDTFICFQFVKIKGAVEIQLDELELVE